MTTVVEVGPVTVRGPGAVAPERVRQAIDGIDDRITLLGERPVTMRSLWRDVLEAAAPELRGALVVVVPTWWPAKRAEVLTAAAGDFGAEVTVVRRAAVLGEGTRATVVEVSTDVVVIAAPGSPPAASPRDDAAVVDLLTNATEVLFDIAAGVDPPKPAVITQLRTSGVPVSFSDSSSLAASAQQAWTEQARTEQPRTKERGPVAAWWRRPLPALLAGVALTLAGAAGAVLARAPSEPADATALLVEGRVAIRVPADWVAERLTDGPGSARVRIAAPGGSAALHLTQSSAPTAESAGESLRRALAAEPPGLFTDFDADARLAGRPAITYREHRPGTEITWAVVVDGTLRVAIGCQSRAGRRDEVTEACLEAVRSARAVR